MNLTLSHDELREIVQALYKCPTPGDSRLYTRLAKLVEPQRTCLFEDCAKPFLPKRRHQLFCSPLCSQIQRQREYWVRRGKKVRQLRMRAGK